MIIIIIDKLARQFLSGNSMYMWAAEELKTSEQQRIGGAPLWQQTVKRLYYFVCLAVVNVDWLLSTTDKIDSTRFRREAWSDGYFCVCV